MTLRILGVASKVGEKGVALKVGMKAASHLTPLHAPGSDGYIDALQLSSG